MDKVFRKKFLILVAMEKEYELVKEALKDSYLKGAEEHEGSTSKMCIGSRLILIITQVGQVPAAILTTSFLENSEIERVINVGFVASYSHQYNILDVVKPSVVVSGSFDLPSPFKKRDLVAGAVIDVEGYNLEENLTLVTCDEFVHIGNLKSIERRIRDLEYKRLVFDMEGFSIAVACKCNEVAFSFYKVISDHVDKEENINLFLESIERDNPFVNLPQFISEQE